MKNSILLTVALFLGIYSNAQDLIIEYDYISKTTQYFKVNKKGDTVKLKAPIVRQDQDVQVKVINFNEHALYVETEVTNENLVESSNPFGLLNMLSPIFNVASKGVLTNMFDERGVDISSIENEFGFTSSTGQSDPQLKSAQSDFMDLNEKIYDLAQLEESIKTIEFGLNQLYLLSRNSDFKPEQIKEQARQIVSTTLDNGDNPELTSFYYKREDILRDSREQIAAAKIISKDVLIYDQFDNKDNFGFSSAENVRIYEQMTMETEQLLYAVEQFEASYSRTEIEQMLQLMQSLYFSIQNSSFEYNTNALAEGDRTNINVSFYDVPPIKTIGNDDDLEELDEENYEDEEEEIEDEWDLDFGYSLATPQQNQYAPKRTKTFKVKVSGGLKISPSIGVAFPSYLGAAKDYFARGDSTIVEVDGDNFVPNIAAFVNFYPYTGKAVNFGGSFGVGIPIKGDNISPSFLLGGSLVLGNKYRIAISGGMATGPVTRLENGFEVGQELLEFQDLETKTKYAIGFYSSISFTIGVGG